jgi:hypothetical protein
LGLIGGALALTGMLGAGGAAMIALRAGAGRGQAQGRGRR